jgi:hypothetical protein
VQKYEEIPTFYMKCGDFFHCLPKRSNNEDNLEFTLVVLRAQRGRFHCVLMFRDAEGENNPVLFDNNPILFDNNLMLLRNKSRLMVAILKY